MDWEKVGYLKILKWRLLDYNGGYQIKINFWKLKLYLEQNAQPTCCGVLALEFAQYFRQGDSLSGLAVLFRVLN